MDKPEFAYIGRRWCGCVVSAMVEDTDPKKRKHLGKEVGSWIADGLTVERVPVEQVKLNWDCEHKTAAVTDQLSLFA